MADSHDFAVVRRAGGNCELGGKRLRVERERMVADDGEPLGEPFENTAAVRRDFSGFAVHHALCVNDLHPEDFTDRLMTEADAEHRDPLSGARPDEVREDSGFFGN